MSSNILVLFGTMYGQTAKVARFVTDELRAAGARVDCVEAGTADPRPEDYDAVIVAASINVGGYQRSVGQWVHHHARALATRPTVFLSVCLAVLQKDPAVRRDLERIVARFARRTGWQPGEVHFVPGALKYREYGWITRLAMRWIAGRAGGETDTSRDYEYTDWADLRVLTLGFLAALQEAMAVHS